LNPARARSNPDASIQGDGRRLDFGVGFHLMVRDRLGCPRRGAAPMPAAISDVCFRILHGALDPGARK